MDLRFFIITMALRNIRISTSLFSGAKGLGSQQGVASIRPKRDRIFDKAS